MAECDSIDSPECSSVETSNLNNQQFRLNKINEIKDYFISEIKEKEIMSKKIIKYIASFDYFDESLIVLYATSGSIPIALFATVIRTSVEIATTIVSLTFSLSTGLVKEF